MKIKISGCMEILGEVKHVYDIDNTSFSRKLRRFIYEAQDMKGFILRDYSLVFYFCLLIRDLYLRIHYIYWSHGLSHRSCLCLWA